MFMSRKQMPKAAPPRPVFRHDYRQQWDGHRLFVGACHGMAFVTGEGIRDLDVIETMDGDFRVHEVQPFEDSDLHLVRLEAMQ